MRSDIRGGQKVRVVAISGSCLTSSLHDAEATQPRGPAKSCVTNGYKDNKWLFTACLGEEAGNLGHLWRGGEVGPRSDRNGMSHVSESLSDDFK